MESRRAISFAKKGGIKDLISHLTGRLFGVPQYIRSASTIDFRLANLRPSTSIEEFISNLLPNISFAKIKNSVAQAKSAIDELNKIPASELNAPERWNSGKDLQYILTSLILIKKPKVVVETGTANGASAAAIALGIKLNSFGHAWSFDISDINPVLIPKELRSFITLVKTTGTRTELINQISKIGNLDNAIFLHDSDHSYVGQNSDYNVAEKLGFDLILSDDIDASMAFCDFAKNRGIIYFDAPKFIGAVKNN